MQKAHSNINWENYPNSNTPLNKQNLNKMDNSIDAIDDRVISLDTTKFNSSEANLLVKNVELDEDSGVLKVTYYNGAVTTYSSLLGKLAINFDFDEEAQKMIIYLSGGETKEVDLSSFIAEFEFLESDTISFLVEKSDNKAFEESWISSEFGISLGQDIFGTDIYDKIVIESDLAVSGVSGIYKKKGATENLSIVFTRSKSDPEHIILAEFPGGAFSFEMLFKTDETVNSEKKIVGYLSKKGRVKAQVKEGSIQEKHLRPDYLADIRLVSASAQASSDNASERAKESQSYAIGGTNSRPGEDTDNSKYYYQQSKTIYENFSQAGTVTGVKGNAEGSYRAGNVNLTAENIGAYGKLNIGTSGYNYQSNCIVIRGVSLNEIDESGLYFCDAPLDAPVTTNGFMIAITYAGKIRGMQLFMPLGENQIYKRQNTNGTWGSWEKINAGRAETAINKNGDNVPGIINFVNNARIRFIAPDVTSVHVKGIDFMNKAGNGIWGGIGAYGQGGQNTAIYLAADTPGPWEPANGLFVTSDSIKWKNSNLVTENSGVFAKKEWTLLGEATAQGGSYRTYFSNRSEISVVFFLSSTGTELKDYTFPASVLDKLVDNGVSEVELSYSESSHVIMKEMSKISLGGGVTFVNNSYNGIALIYAR